MSRLKIALLHDWILNWRGAEHLLLAFSRLLPTCSVYTLFFRPNSTHPALRDLSVNTSWFSRLPCVERYYRYLLPLFPSAAGTLNANDADLVISIHHSVAKGIPHRRGIPHICYCLTPMRYLWEPSVYGPKVNESWQGRMLRMLSWYLKKRDLESNEAVTHFVAISQTVQERIRKFYGRSSEIIYPGVDTDFFRPASRTRGSFYLVVSALVPQKRIDLAVDAFSRLNKPLVVAGEGPLKKSLEKRSGETVTFLGRVPDTKIRELYQEARALVFPGLEDFGLVPVEAQSCGCPVIALGRGGAAETVQDGIGGILFPEPEVDTLIRAVERFERYKFNRGVVRSSAERFSMARFRYNWERYLRTITAPGYAVERCTANRPNKTADHRAACSGIF